MEKLSEIFGTIIGLFCLWKFVDDIYDQDMERKDG